MSFPPRKTYFFSILSRPTLQKRVCPRPTDKYFQICQNTFFAFLSIAFAFVSRALKYVLKVLMIFKAYFFYITLRSIKPHYEQLLMMILKMIPLFWLKFYYACFNEKETEWYIFLLFADDLPQKSPQHVPASCDIEAFLEMLIQQKNEGEQLYSNIFCNFSILIRRI